MGVDCRIYLPGNVQLDKVVLVIGKLIGLPAVRTSVNENPPGFAQVTGVSTRSASCQLDCAVMDFVIPKEIASYKYRGSSKFYLLYQFESGHGSDRVILASSTAFHIAIFKGLADFFGGEVNYAEGGGNHEFDYTIPFKSDNHNQPVDGVPFWDLQQRIFDLKPLTEMDFKAAEACAAYKE